jgi:tRNA (adenine22-N1)-methyltransferase
MIKLSPRLNAIANMVTKGAKVIDIGCDHALLDIYLYQNNISNKIIATDINKNALNNAKENIKKYFLDKKIITRLGDGLNPLHDDDINTIIISGMGAHTIVDIFKNGKEKLNNISTIIIQSNTKIEYLRKKMSKLDYMITDENIVLDNKKYYTIIKYGKGRRKYNKKELYFGPILLTKRDKVFIDSIKNDYNKLKQIEKNLPKGKLITKYKIKREIKLYNNVI